MGEQGSVKGGRGGVVDEKNQYKDQNQTKDMGRDGGSSPATLQAAKAVDFHGCLPGHCIEAADAEQAYIQVDMKGDPTWICLPPEARPAWWLKKFPQLRRPVCRLKKALYWNQDAGTHWEQKFVAQLKTVGFDTTGAELPAVSFH